MHGRRLVLELIVERLGRRGPGNAFARCFSDDTVVTDLKMTALAQWRSLLQRPGFAEQEPRKLLWRCFLSQLQSWARGPAGGALFQGYGGFTKGLLRPDAGRGGCCGQWPSVDIQEKLPGCDTWPEEWFVQHADLYCSGTLPGSCSGRCNPLRQWRPLKRDLCAAVSGKQPQAI
ncbi:unnamed protein product [Polarella glacialis]|uniref:Uncharacterized protein n=1 Tax=Polarella glacialis TaxID=89957 RepID=A0A813LLQ1_POLGL|nr:unnamed protein product [Polarella glacialis]